MHGTISEVRQRIVQKGISLSMETKAIERKPLSKVWIVLLLGSLTSFGPLSMDMYLPSLPIVAENLQATTSLTQLSLTACLLGLGFGQLIFGPLSDIQGRRKPLVFTLSIYSITSILCAFSPNIWVFVILRFIQGLTGAAGIVIARASARDMYSGTDLTKFTALLALVHGAAPILSPVIGGIILTFTTWNVVFLILGLIGMIMLISVYFFLPETLPVERRAEGKVLAVFTTFGNLLKNPTFIGISLTQALIMSSMFAYIAGSPFILQNIYGVTPQYFAVLFAINGLGIILAAQTTGRLAGIVDEKKLLLTGIILSFTGSCLLIITIYNELSLAAMAVSLFLVVSSVGMVSTTAFSLAMQSQGRSAGSASAFLGLLPFIGGGIVSPLVGIAGESSAVPMGLIIMTCSTSALLAYVCLVNKIK